jgi:hypothetical protein
MSKKILQVNFKLKVPAKEYEKICDQLAAPIAKTKGLAWKVWIINDANKEAGGIYLFEDDSSLKKYTEGEIVKMIMSHPAVSDINAKIFDVMEKHTKTTCGPID